MKNPNVIPRDPSSLKNNIIRKIAKDMDISNDVVEKVINHQFMGVVTAMSKSDANTVEISGFGKFRFRTIQARYLITRAQAKIAQMCEAGTPDKIKDFEDFFKYVKMKLRED